MPDQEYAAGAKYGAIGGKVVVREALKTVAGTRAPEVYRTERYGMSGYRFDVPDGKYAVALHFCETYERLTQSGERVFSVKIQGKPVLADFDVLKEAGGPARPVVKEFKNIEVTDGRLSIEFVPKIQNPEINGIEVFAQ
jgi:beta-galactosidase